MTEELWLEKYRPKLLSEVVGNSEIVETLRDLGREKNFPNLILSGPPGCGKTTSVLALCREILEDNYSNATIELNASDERGIDVVRDKIKIFAERMVRLPPGRHKVVILDEADSLTESAQQALRMIISNYSSTTRFVFSCNNSNKIIEPIQSRCGMLRFSKLADEDILKFVLRVIDAENEKAAESKLEQIVYDKEGLEALVYVADGDMRNAINNLQAIHISTGLVNKENVFMVCDVPSMDLTEEMIGLLLKGKLDEGLDRFEKLWKEDYCLHDLVVYFSRSIERINQIPIDLRMELMVLASHLKMNQAQGVISKTQFLGFLAKVCHLGIAYYNS